MESIENFGSCKLHSIDKTPYRLKSNPTRKAALKRASRVLSNLKAGHVETSIVPSYIIRKMWYDITKGDSTKQLVVWEAFDGGCYFKLLKKS